MSWAERFALLPAGIAVTLLIVLARERVARRRRVEAWPDGMARKPDLP